MLDFIFRFLRKKTGDTMGKEENKSAKYNKGKKKVV